MFHVRRDLKFASLDRRVDCVPEQHPALFQHHLILETDQIPGTKQVTVGGDKAYDMADFVADCRNLKVTPHVARNLGRPGGNANADGKGRRKCSP